MMNYSVLLGECSPNRADSSSSMQITLLKSYEICQIFFFGTNESYQGHQSWVDTKRIRSNPVCQTSRHLFYLWGESLVIYGLHPVNRYNDPKSNPPMWQELTNSLEQPWNLRDVHFFVRLRLKAGLKHRSNVGKQPTLTIPRPSKYPQPHLVGDQPSVGSQAPSLQHGAKLV
jgi:hypothetical protein